MRAAVRAAARHHGPVYLRAGRPKALLVYPDGKADFVIGQADVVRAGHDVTVIACGLMTGAALEAAETLAGEGVSTRVVNMATLRPLDVATIESAARETGALVVAEEHIHHGGLGSAVAMAAAARCPVPIEFVNMGDRYAESGTPEELMVKYGLTARDVAEAVRRAAARK